MKFHLQFPILPFFEKINYSHSFLFIGSCFAENIGDLMVKYKFNCNINPNGILYNPISIADALKRYIKNDLLNENDLFYANECWNSWEHHSKFSNSDKQKCLTEINKNIAEAHHSLKNTEWIFITLGSSFIYKREGQLVGNCHKQNHKEFTKSMLTVQEIVTTYNDLIVLLKKLNPKLKIVFTVSPVRYVRDGVVENSIGKAVLIQAVHELVKQNPGSFYFPAYELMTDDLRDYRFYKSDMVHPNEQAIDYIFEKLKEVIFDEQTKELFVKVKEIIVAKEHRPFNSHTSEFEKFKKVYSERCSALQKDYSFLDLKSELLYFGT